MIYQIIDLPRNIVGFKASWEVTPQDFDEVVIPCVQKHVEKTGHINYLLVLNTSLKTGASGTWFKDAMLTLKTICKWNRAAIVSDSKALSYLPGILSFFVNGEFNVFTHDELPLAINWVSESSK